MSDEEKKKADEAAKKEKDRKIKELEEAKKKTPSQPEWDAFRKHDSKK